jgi:DNA anti-recombination protein RmuC
LSVDHAETDSAIREEIQKCEEMALDMISKHVDERKASDARITRFVDDKCAVIRDLIDRENKERATVIKDIEDSLDKDLSDIREKLERDCNIREERIEGLHAEFAEEYEKMRNEFNELCEKYSDSEAEFYKMLREVLKKVKKEVA